MTVRLADADDVEELARLRAAWSGRPISAEFVASFRDWFLREQATRWWWIAAEDGNGAGMVNLKVFDRMPSPDRPASRWGYLANLFVTAERRGSGIGAALVAAPPELADRTAPRNVPGDHPHIKRSSALIPIV